MATTEFALIEKYFNKKKFHRPDVLLGIGDDAALLQVPANQSLVACIDTLVAGVHFPPDTSAFDIGYKAVAVNLSDLAAMGSEPAWLTLALTLLSADEQWLEQFCAGFFTLADQFNVQLVGGDLTRGPLTISVQAHGFVPPAKAIKRSGAQPGDLIYVTGTLGDAGLALRLLKENQIIPAEILRRLNRPTPRIAEGIALRDLASSAIDISDGLLADLRHILTASQVGATVLVDIIPLSSSFKKSATAENALELALTAGDDYELCFTISPDKEKELLSQFKQFPCDITCIGIIDATAELKLQYSSGKIYNPKKLNGYHHF